MPEKQKLTTETPYKIPQKEVGIPLKDGGEARAERITIKKTAATAYRFSWWKDGRLAPRPLDLEPAELLKLIQVASEKDVFPVDFKLKLIHALSGK